MGDGKKNRSNEMTQTKGMSQSFRGSRPCLSAHLPQLRCARESEQVKISCSAFVHVIETIRNSMLHGVVLVLLGCDIHMEMMPFP